MKQYIPLNGKKQLELDVYYSLGGMNYFTYKQEPRGYYGSVTPVEVSDNMISFGAFSGIKTFLFACKRKSPKAEAEALKIWETKKQDLIDKVLGKEVERTDLKALSKKYNLSFPPAFEGYTETELLNTPVYVVDGNGGRNFPTLEDALCTLRTLKLCGPFHDNGRLRFETPEICDMLSR